MGRMIRHTPGNEKQRVLSGRPWASVLAVCLMLGTGTASPAQDADPGLLERLGKLFQQRGRVREDAVPAPANPQRPADLVKTRRERLDAWCDSYLRWLVEELAFSDDQQRQIGQLLSGEVERNQRQWKERPGNFPLPDTTVIVFAGHGGPVARISGVRFEKELLKVLNPEQKRIWKVESLTRKLRICDQYARRATAIVDTELFLLPELREAVFQVGRKAYRNHGTNGLYAFHAQGQYMQRESLTSFVGSVDDEFWSEAQKRRLDDLRQPWSEQKGDHFVVRGGQPEEFRHDQVGAICQTAERRFLNGIAVHTSWLATSLRLTPKQARHLEVAGKGSAIRCLRSWKKSTRRTLDRMTEQLDQPHISIRLTPPDVGAVEHDQLWKHTLNGIISSAGKDNAADRDKWIRATAVDFVLATLDRELTLSENQIPALRKLIETTQPHLTPDSQPRMAELAMVVRTISRIKRDSLDEILAEPQLSCWKLIESQFRLQLEKRIAVISVQHGTVQVRLGP